jgi:NAD(P)-dependent dehydrogenase (short-subunit alcohol dehydrogenase family)
MTSTSSLEGKRALVTGGSRGIGATIVPAARLPGSRSRGADAGRAPRSDCELGGTPFTLTALTATISDVLGTRIAYQDVSASDHNGVLKGSRLPRRWPPPPPMPVWLADSCSPLVRCP